MSSLTVEAAEDQKWVPTHVQVTVLRGRGLRGKGKHNTSDVYTIIQLGKEKYSTCVVEKTTEPEWREECSFELLQPDVNNDLVLTVMHRAVMGLDVFLGQAVVHLEKIFNETRYVKNEWYKLNSKSGKKEKERGDIQVTIQFTRNNLTASMYDLVMKDKSASTFGKLKERIRGKKRASEEDSQSAVLPGGYGNLYKMRQRLPSDGGGEEEYEDDEGGEARRSKMRTYFLRGKLRKSSDTRSSTSLGSESSESSSRGGSLSPTAAISLVVSDLSNSPSNSSNLTADNSPEHTGNTSPKSCSLICEFGDDDDEAGEISILVPQPTVTVNGSHTYDFPRQPLDPGSGNPVDSLGLGLGLQKSLPMSVSLQNLNPRTTDDLPLPKGVVVGDGRRWSFDKPDEEEKAAIAAALEQSGPMVADDDEDESLGFDAVSPKAASSSSSMTESEGHGKKPKRNFFSHGGKGQKDETDQGEEKHRGWFGSKETHSKPSLVVSPKVQSPTNPHPPPLPRSQHPPGPPVDPGSPLHHSNPFCRSQTTSPPMSPCNPFFSLIQQNPFYEDILTPQPSNPSSLPPLPYLSTARPPIATLFPQSNNPNPYPNLTYNSPASEDSIMGTDTKQELKAKLERRPLPPIPTKGEERLNNNLFKDFKSAGRLEPESEWDEGFEAFAAGRLQSPEELTTDCNTQQNTPSDNPLEHCNIKGSSQHITDAVQNTNVNDALQHQPCTELIFQAHTTIVQATNTNMHHFDAFAQFLETIPEHTSFESDPITSNSPANSPKLDACTETNEANSTSTNTTDLTDTNLHQDPHQASSVKPNSVSPDHTSSGIGSAAEEDLISCLSSSYSDKFSASSSEETEAQNFESNILYFEKSVESALDKHLQALHSKDDITDRSNDLSLVAQDTFIGHRDGDEKADINGLEGSVAPQSPVLTNQEPAIGAIETGSEDAVSQALSEIQPDSNGSPQHDNEKEEEKGILEFSGSPEDLSKVLDESFVSLSSTTDAISPNNELCSADPSINIITSSTGLRQNTSKNTLEGQDSIQSSPILFGLIGDFQFANTSSITNIPSEGFDDPLLNTPVSNQSTSSFLTSLYVTTSSQDYQSCGSDQSSSFSWPNNMLQSANSTLCGEPSDLQSTIEDVLDQDDSTNAPKPSTEEMNQTEQSEESILEAKDKTSTLEPRFTLGDDFDSEFLTAESTDSYTSCDPSKIAEGVAESPHVNLDEVLSNCPQAESATLHRSQSEGTLIPTFDELLLPSFGSDPGAIQESNSLSKPGPDLNLTSLTSFAPFLTPGSSSSPVVLCTFPSLATAIVRSPPEKTSTPKPQETPQQAASQQNSPHPVKPLSTAPLAEERRTEGRSVLATGLEKLKSTIHPGRSSHVSEQETERKKSLTEGAGSYYHLNHSELVALLVQRESDLERQKTEFERQRFLLAKREVELRRLKPQVRDLEDYIDTLLVRIMEQKPTLLQVRSKLK